MQILEISFTFLWISKKKKKVDSKGGNKINSDNKVL